MALKLCGREEWVSNEEHARFHDRGAVSVGGDEFSVLLADEEQPVGACQSIFARLLHALAEQENPCIPISARGYTE